MATRMANLMATITGQGQRIGEAPAAVGLHITHEVDPLALQDRTIREVFVLDTPTPKTKVAFSSHVSYRPAQLANSPAYLASVRRKGTSQIKKLAVDLANYAQSDDFAAYTQQVLVELKQLLKTIADAEELRNPRSEANSCEILRQLRDSLLNDGWREYRKPNVRRIAIDALRFLSEADSVAAADAFKLGDSLLDLGIEPAVGAMTCEEEPDVEEEEVLD